MDERDIRKWLENVRRGQVTIESAVEQLRQLPYEDLGFAKIDHHRTLRQGYPEVIYGRGKTPKQVTDIVRGMLRADASHNILITRADRNLLAAVKRLARRGSGLRAEQITFHELSGAIAIERTRTVHGKGLILIVTAGTSDIPVAEEAQLTAEVMGNEVEAIYDIGVAGIHRLMYNRERLTEARVVVVCAGMEGALPSVVGGLVSCPVIAVPTSVGYGASFHGLAALLGMLNSCASNVTVVNIDNGFGAGYVASLINRL